MRLSTSTEWLFFHLWKKNPETNQSCPGVIIADTIIYRWAKPFFWYFTTKDGQILRKTKERVFVEDFKKIFVSGQNDNDICAMNLTTTEIQSQQDQSEKIEFEYFDKKGFINFLDQREKSLNGLLQKFIVPKGSRNQLIKVSWSPQFCLLSRKTNLHKIESKHVGLAEKLATFDGNEHLSHTDSIASPFLSNILEQICINIVKHIQEVSGGNIQISKMVMYFKLDSQNRIWLLFCTSIKVREKYINLDNKKDKQANEKANSPILCIKQLKSTNTSSMNIHNKVKYSQEHFIEHLKYENNEHCSNCLVQTQVQYEIEIKHLVESYENRIYDQESIKIFDAIEQQNNNFHNGNQNNELIRLLDEDEEDYYNEESKNIPGIIQKLWGKLSYEKYQILRKNPSWLNLKTKVCDTCFIKFTQLSTNNKIEKETMIKGQQTSNKLLRVDKQINIKPKKLNTLSNTTDIFDEEQQKLFSQKYKILSSLQKYDNDKNQIVMNQNNLKQKAMNNRTQQNIHLQNQDSKVKFSNIVNILEHVKVLPTKKQQQLNQKLTKTPQRNTSKRNLRQQKLDMDPSKIYSRQSRAKLPLIDTTCRTFVSNASTKDQPNDYKFLKETIRDLKTCQQTQKTDFILKFIYGIVSFKHFIIELFVTQTEYEMFKDLHKQRFILFEREQLKYQQSREYYEDCMRNCGYQYSKLRDDVSHHFFDKMGKIIDENDKIFENWLK